MEQLRSYVDERLVAGCLHGGDFILAIPNPRPSYIRWGRWRGSGNTGENYKETSSKHIKRQAGDAGQSPTRRKRPKTAHISELKEAADRLASAFADVDEEELVAEFKELRRRGKGASR